MRAFNISATAVAASAALLFVHVSPLSAEDFVRGRVNKDDSVNLSDAITVLGYLFLGEETPTCLKAADTDDDGAVTITDAVYLLNFLFLGGDPLPAPYPDAGPDPTADDLFCGAEPITELLAGPSPLAIASVGGTAQLEVTGKIAGTSIDLHLATTGTTYSSSDARIAGVYRDGLVEARAPGSAEINVYHGDLETHLQVTVSAQGGSSTHHVLAVNDLGMHCMDREFSIFSILPPFNVLHAQVVRSEALGKVSLLDASQVVTHFSPAPDSNGSTTSTSLHKTNFWDYAQDLFGLELEPGQGLLGQYMPDDAPSPGPQALPWDGARSWFNAAGIPITPYDDANEYNPYPLLRVTAFDKISGKPLAHTDIVVPVSQEIDCQSCHATGQVAAKAGFIRWWKDADLEVQAKKNILTIHDYRSNTTLIRSTPVLCANCHYSAALDLAGAGPNEEQRKHSSLSHAMHAFHGVQKDENGAPLFPVGAPPEKTCYNCHPGKITQCQRGVMRTGGMLCGNCHAEMLSVGGILPLAVGGSLDGQNDGNPRRPWMDMPRCQSCHTGDALSHLSGPDYLQADDGLRLKQAFRGGDDAASPILASNKRFAENDNTLYRFSKGHGGVLCENCHGSAHAEWPNADPDHNDNVAATQLQGHAGTLVECTACHAQSSVALSLGGPHGLHPVNDLRWVKGRHGNVYETQSRECQACHGPDLKVGSPLAKAADDRTFRIEDNQTVRIAKGQVVTCNLCHEWPKRDD